jgi:Xaa-Pro aminopeptidase
MKLFSKDVYTRRRALLSSTVAQGQILIMGNNEAPMNYIANAYRFRQDSNFLYYFGINLPGLAGLIDGNKTLIFGHELTMDDIIWEGPVEPLSSLAEKVGVTEIHPLEDLPDFLRTDEVHYLPPYRGERTLFLRDTLGLRQGASVPLIKAVVAQRAIKTAEEIKEMSRAVDISGQMHVAAMKACLPGKPEYEVVAEILKTVKYHNTELAYPIILSVNGQTLHNHYHGNEMKAGQLMLNDSGAETDMYYAGDITRTYPVSGKFTAAQKDIYEIVLKMEEDSIAAMKPGVSYRDIHLQSNRILIEGLKGLGILKGDTEILLEEGVGGMFMPHGLGHAIGLDVHDMEDLGEEYVGYREGITRSTQLGLKSLRFAKELEVGNVLTVEPGCYFIPELISKYKQENKFAEFVNYSKLDAYLSFGGVRIEDNVLVTATGHETLGKRIPKTVEEIESI